MYLFTWFCDSKEGKEKNASIHHEKYWKHRFFVLLLTHFSSRNIHELQLMEGTFEHSFVNFILWISENYETTDMCLNNKAFPIEYP